jgi:hypothetical protein
VPLVTGDDDDDDEPVTDEKVWTGWPGGRSCPRRRVPSSVAAAPGPAGGLGRRAPGMAVRPFPPPVRHQQKPLINQSLRRRLTVIIDNCTARRLMENSC